MMRFIRTRGLALAGIALVMVLIALSQAGISYSVGRGPLRNLEPAAFPVVAAGLYGVRVAFLVLLAILWLANRKRTMFQTIIAANVYFTVVLLLYTFALMRVLGGFREAASAMLIDAALMSLSNILIFSVWYWIIDPPGVDEKANEAASWAFLFPQRDRVALYPSWSPDYADYLFLAFTTNFAFSPTDALPLTRAAKMLMLLQAAISVVIITGIAGGAINALVGG
jgi:hypothetical protein